MIPVNIKTDKYDVLGDRRSKYGNPFLIGRDGTREDVIRLFDQYWQENKQLQEEAKNELKDKRVGCWCKPLPCHLDIIAETVNNERSP